MPKTSISCPRCRQPIPANVEQLFDVSADPGAKQRLLGGISNYARCPYCGFEGRLATPIVYHDADKELLLTYFPPEMGLPVNEQEKLVGPLIKKIADRLPADKRKAYLFSPKSHLTYESLIETILGKDGITPEMIKAQQERLHLIDRLAQASAGNVRSEIIKENAGLIDEQFFALFSRLLQGAAVSGQEQLANRLVEVQKQLLAESDLGRKIQASVGELEAATKALEEAGPQLTREKLLDLVIQSPNEERLRAYVSLTRAGMDYVFFQLLTEKIDASTGKEKKRLEGLRERLLDYVNEIDRQIEARFEAAQELVESLLAQEDVARATRENLDKFTQDAVEVVNTLMRQASEKNDYTRLGKLQKMLEVLREASAPPPEVALIEQLLEVADEAAVERLLKENEPLVNQAFMDALSGLMVQLESQGGGGSEETKALAERLGAVYRAALKFSMKKQMR